MEQKTKGLTKKNIYLILLATAIVVIALAVIIALATNSTKTLEKPKTSTSTSTSVSVSKTPTSSKKPSSSSPKPSTSEPTTPTTVPIVFINPVSGGEVLNEYTSASVIYNKTLGIYTGHMGLDITGKEGAEVFAVYDGEIASITTSYLEGTTITIDHGENLSTVYNSIEAVEGLSVGQTVSKGDKLGVISTNNRQEYKDGAHLHFEVKENNATVDPYKYLDIDGK